MYGNGRDAKTTRVALRVQTDAKARWQAAATRTSRTLSDWITIACDRAAAENEILTRRAAFDLPPYAEPEAPVKKPARRARSQGRRSET